tara:strand:- start:47 stop:763 length:717 start_codon:yes stop_codon:yes gene_type:complete
MFVPYRIIASQNYKKKLDRKNVEQTIFEDKIVNKKAEPTLYNIEAGLSTVKTNTGHCLTLRQKRRGKASGLPRTRSDSARELLTLINVQPVQLPRKFSLLSAQTDQEIILNPNIFYDGDFTNRPAGVSITFDSGPFSVSMKYGHAPVAPGFDSGPFNVSLTDGVKEKVPSTWTKDKFKVAGDPFYLLDESSDVTKNEEIKRPTFEQVKQQSDLSHIAANFNILNNSPDYFGKNKYFKD